MLYLLYQQNIIIIAMEFRRICSLLFLLAFSIIEGFDHGNAVDADNYISAVGDPGMRRDGLRVAIESWNQCNEVGEEAINMGSPRMADCFDIDHSTAPGETFYLSYFSIY